MLRYRSYIVNLTVEDILRIPSITNLLKLALEVVKYFKGSYVLIKKLNSAARLVGKQRAALQLLRATR